MRRADRLFQIIQILRRRRVTTAAQLGSELEVSERTIYRDIRDLMSSGVSIRGEAGVGYALPRSFDFPPLMFTGDEIEALVLGVRMVQAWADVRLDRAAADVLAKVKTVLPAPLRRHLTNVPIFAPVTEAGDRMLANFVDTNPVPVKLALQLMGRMKARYRLPLVAAEPESESVLRGALIEAGLLEAAAQV